MKINKNYIKKNIAGDVVLIPTGEAAQYFNGLIGTNEVAAFIWENIEKCETCEEMVQYVINEFDGDEEKIRKDVFEFLETLKKAEFIEY